jgi:hypothetical protein
VQFLKAHIEFDISITPFHAEDVTLIRSAHRTISESGNGQNTQATDLSVPSKSCSFSYINGSKVAAHNGT